MADLSSDPADQALNGAYDALAPKIDAADSPTKLAVELHSLIGDLVKKDTTGRVRDTARHLAHAQMATIRDIRTRQQLDEAKTMAKGHLRQLLLAFGGNLAELAVAGNVGAASRLPFQVAADKMTEFLPEFLGKYVMHILAPLSIDDARVPNQLPVLYSRAFAARLGSVVQKTVSPFLMQFRIMKVRVIENFNVGEQGVSGLLDMMADPRDNAIHHVWNIFWEPPPEPRRAAAPASTNSLSDQNRLKVLQAAWTDLNQAGHGELNAREIDVLRELIRLPYDKVLAEFEILRANVVKERQGSIRQGFVRDRLEKLIMGDMPRYVGELMALKLCAEYPEFFNEEWAKWFVAGYRDRKECVALFTLWYPKIRAALGR